MSNRLLHGATIVALIVLAVLQLHCRRSQPITIRFAGEKWFLDDLTKTNMIGAFERQTGIQVEVIHKDHQALVAELEQKPVSHKVTYDLILMRHRFLGELVEKGLVQAVDSYLADATLHDLTFKPRVQLFDNWWQEISWYKSKMYGYPFTELTPYVCYRKDLLDDPIEQAYFRARYHRHLEPPKTWGEYMQLAEFFTRPKQQFYGTYIQGQNHIALWYEWLNFVYSFGGNILDTKHGDEYGDIVVNSPQNLAATDQYLKLIPFSPPDTLSYNWNGAQAALQQGRVFMGILWNDQAPLLEDPFVSKVPGKIGYTTIPSATGRPVSQLEGWSYLIPKDSTNPREAYRFIEWAMSPEVQAQETLKGGESPSKATYEDSRVTKLPYVSAFLASVPIAIPKPTIPESAQMTEVMQRALSEIVTRKRAPKGGLDMAALEIQNILGTKARLRYPVDHR
jgi:multiple sugar transport system substrate-binding protein